jgi:16S rRNA pseudouridine516 synthase
VIDLLPSPYRGRGLFPAGRLDKDTVGLLLLTNDGTFAHNMLSPKKHVPKTYFARIDQEVSHLDQKAFLDGVLLEDGYKTLPAQLTILSGGETSEVELTICEGKFHQVKRMFEAVSKKVIYLKRTKIGAYCLPPMLQEGEIMEISEKEIKDLVFSAK